MGKRSGAEAVGGMAQGVLVIRCLLIGCGNTLRKDDALGINVVNRWADRSGPTDIDVRTITVPQLDLLLVPQIHEADFVILVDARMDESDAPLKTYRFQPNAGADCHQHSSHVLSMPTLLRLVAEWYGEAPDCYAVLPKGYDFSLSDSLSHQAEISAQLADERIAHILETRTQKLVPIAP